MSVCSLRTIRFIAVGIACTVALLCGGVAASMAQAPGQQEKDAVSIELKQWQVLAVSPGVKIVSQNRQTPGKLLPSGENPLDTAYNWLADQGLEEGRNVYKGKLLYVSVGSASVNAIPSDPKYIDSRFLAFQRAELEAKAKTAIFLGVDLTTERGGSEREINPEERVELEAIVRAGTTLNKNIECMGISKAVYGLFRKAHLLAEAKLDKALAESGVDVEAEEMKARKRQKETRAKKDRMKNLRNISQASLKAAASAFAEVEGAQIIQSFEGSYHNNYQVVVVTLWSHNLQRMVDCMRWGTAPSRLPRKQAKEEVARQLPTDTEELACLTGVRVYINQTGEHVLLAFGQAGVEVLGGREDKAFELAGKKARTRAMAAMRNFMGEKVAFASSEALTEALALYAQEYKGDTGAQDYRSISQFQEKIEAEAKKQKITGLQGLMTTELKHPFTDKPMVLKVMSWSPSSQAMSQEVKQAITYGADEEVKTKQAVKDKVEGPARKGIISSGKGADKDAW